MVNILRALIIAIPVVYLLHVGYHSIVKRQRMDWPSERKLFRESAAKGCRIVIRLMRWYWHRF